MKRFDSPDPVTKERPGRGSGRWRLLVGGCLLLIVIAILSPRVRDKPNAPPAAAKAPGNITHGGASDVRQPPRFRRSSSASLPEASAEEIVAGKVLQFGRSRREIVRAIARRSQKKIPAEVEEFFDAIESGDWAEIDRQWKALAKRSSQYEGSTDWPELDPFWPSVLDAYGVAEQAHLWPAQKLLDYGNAILDSLRPGMVYVGGTDPGRWIPELLNETGGGEPHIIVTQNAFADGRYLEFMNTLYGERFSALTDADSKRAFADYIEDAQKRWEHDQQFPDEPKQTRPGENSKMVDGKFQVSGQVAVMAINEKMLHLLMEKNPDLSFAIEQSFPFKSTYEGATPAGPIMELRAQEQNALTSERAGQAVDYWRATAQQLQSDSQADSYAVRMSYAKLAAEQAELLRNRNYTAEAEQTFRFAVAIAPANPEAVFRYVELLEGQNRSADAIAVTETALKASQDAARWASANGVGPHFESKQFQDLLNRLQKEKKN